MDSRPLHISHRTPTTRRCTSYAHGSPCLPCETETGHHINIEDDDKTHTYHDSDKENSSPLRFTLRDKSLIFTNKDVSEVTSDIDSFYDEVNERERLIPEPLFKHIDTDTHVANTFQGETDVFGPTVSNTNPNGDSQEIKVEWIEPVLRFDPYVSPVSFNGDNSVEGSDFNEKCNIKNTRLICAKRRLEELERLCDDTRRKIARLEESNVESE